MPVFRVNKTDNYTVMSNYHFRNNKMSLKAMGLLSLMLSLPDGWDYSVQGLIKLSKDGKSGTTAALKELEQYGHLQRVPVRTGGKISDWVYNIYEKPLTDFQEVENLEVENLEIENQEIENQDVENPPQLNTYISNTKGLTTKKSNTKKDLYISARPDAASFNDEAVQEAFNNFVADRKERGKPMTTRAINIAVKKVNELSNGNPENAIEIINQSIEKGWSGIFPLQEDKPRRAIPAHPTRSSQSFKDINLESLNYTGLETSL